MPGIDQELKQDTQELMQDDVDQVNVMLDIKAVNFEHLDAKVYEISEILGDDDIVELGCFLEQNPAALFHDYGGKESLLHIACDDMYFTPEKFEAIAEAYELHSSEAVDFYVQKMLASNQAGDIPLKMLCLRDTKSERNPLNFLKPIFESFGDKKYEILCQQDDDGDNTWVKTLIEGHYTRDYDGTDEDGVWKLIKDVADNKPEVLRKIVRQHNKEGSKYNLFSFYLNFKAHEDSQTSFDIARELFSYADLEHLPANIYNDFFLALSELEDDESFDYQAMTIAFYLVNLNEKKINADHCLLIKLLRINSVPFPQNKLIGDLLYSAKCKVITMLRDLRIVNVDDFNRIEKALNAAIDNEGSTMRAKDLQYAHKWSENIMAKLVSIWHRIHVQEQKIPTPLLSHFSVFSSFSFDAASRVITRPLLSSHFSVSSSSSASSSSSSSSSSPLSIFGASSSFDASMEIKHAPVSASSSSASSSSSSSSSSTFGGSRYSLYGQALPSAASSSRSSSQLTLELDTDSVPKLK